MTTSNNKNIQINIQMFQQRTHKNSEILLDSFLAPLLSYPFFGREEMIQIIWHEEPFFLISVGKPKGGMETKCKGCRKSRKC